MKERNTNGNLGKLRCELGRRLIVMRYSKVSAKAYMRIFGWVEEFLKRHGETDYTVELGQRFLMEYPLQTNHSPSQFKNARTLIRRIDEVLEDKQFTPCFRVSKKECPEHYTGLLNKYLDSLVKRGLRKTTIKSRETYVGRLFARIPETVLTIEKLTAADLYEVYTKYEWPSVGLSATRDFLLFLFTNKETKIDLSVCVPRPRRPRALPSVYSPDEVKRLLSSIDRTTSLGKRDYAFLILAAYLGLRSSDIVNLSFDDIDCKAKTIRIVQQKTSHPVTLVMNSDVEEAMNDYIQHGRPKSSLTGSHDKIFLGSQAPYAPLSAGSGCAIAHKHFNLAGIAAQGRNRGPHSLRASYATALVTKGIPYAVVKEALGHEDPESAKFYVRVDIKRLKMCALDVPKPIGAFAVLLNDLEGAL